MDPYGVTAPPTAPEFPLVPRQQRRRQRLARTFLGFLLVLIALGAAGWYVGDRFFGEGDDDEPTQLAVASPPPFSNAATPPPSAASAPTPTRTPRSASLIATATATATAAAAGEPTPAADAETDETSAADDPPADDAESEAEEAAAEERPPIEELLPSEEQLLDGLILAEDSTRTEEEVVASLGSEDAAALLQDWGWDGNVVRVFVSPEPELLEPGSTTYIDVSIHRFASADAAAEALTYFSDQLVALQGLEEIDTDPLGDTTRVLQGAPEGVVLTVAYFQDGVDLIRIGGASNSAEGDPTPDIMAVAETIVEP